MKKTLLLILLSVLINLNCISQTIYPQDELAQVAPEDVMQTILDRYAGQTVVVDMWETWCKPCLVAHDEMEPLKKTFKYRKVVFVYLSSPSSPYDVWVEASKKISGEHYHLTSEQFGYISEQCKADGAVPVYLLFNAKGYAVSAINGWGGVKFMKKKIRDAMRTYTIGVAK